MTVGKFPWLKNGVRFDNDIALESLLIRFRSTPTKRQIASSIFKKKEGGFAVTRNSRIQQWYVEWVKAWLCSVQVIDVCYSSWHATLLVLTRWLFTVNKNALRWESAKSIWPVWSIWMKFLFTHVIVVGELFSGCVSACVLSWKSCNRQTFLSHLLSRALEFRELDTVESIAVIKLIFRRFIS